MGLHELKGARGARSQKRRVGRGDSGRRGSTAGRGLKGQKARGSIRPLFEGGQLPLIKRLPYMRGFTNKFRKVYFPINVDRLNAFDADTEITPITLLEAGIVKKPGSLVKILGDGELDRALKVSAHGFSKSARGKIESAGGTVTVIGAVAPEAENDGED
ncbi:MAG: 50S ribosomal protein L15 [Chloroflexi bacterium]|nr:50S ribosomal protein L15 [Chloroflexota bacterium]